MNTTHARIHAALVAILFMLLSTLPALAEGGNGDGSGDGGGRENPLTLAQSSVANGADNVDPNVRIVLTFTKNVVHFNVKENNMKCFSVRDSKGNDVPIRVEMGDDQVDPDIKRIVTIVPVSPFTAGETYLLTIKSGLTAKNEVNVLEKDLYLSFTIRESGAPAATTAVSAVKPASPNANGATTTTTKKVVETTTKRVTTTRPPITAATRGSTASAVVTALTARSSETTAPAATTTNAVTVSQSSGFGVTIPPGSTPSSTQETRSHIDALPQIEPETVGETTAAETSGISIRSETTERQTEQVTESAGPAKHVSPAVLIGIGIALAVLAGTVIAIQNAKKKG